MMPRHPNGTLVSNNEPVGAAARCCPVVLLMSTTSTGRRFFNPTGPAQQPFTAVPALMTVGRRGRQMAGPHIDQPPANARLQ